MKQNVLKTSLVSVAAALVLFSGCQEVPEDSKTTLSNSSNVETTTNNTNSNKELVQDSNKELATTVKDSIKDVTTSMPTPSKEHLALEEEYNQKLIDCYTSEAESCSDIISEMVDAQVELVYYPKKIKQLYRESNS